MPSGLRNGSHRFNRATRADLRDDIRALQRGQSPPVLRPQANTFNAAVKTAKPTPKRWYHADARLAHHADARLAHHADARLAHHADARLAHHADARLAHHEPDSHRPFGGFKRRVNGEWKSVPPPVDYERQAERQGRFEDAIRRAFRNKPAALSATPMPHENILKAVEAAGYIPLSARDVLLGVRVRLDSYRRRDGVTLDNAAMKAAWEKAGLTLVEFGMFGRKPYVTVRAA